MAFWSIRARSGLAEAVPRRARFCRMGLRRAPRREAPVDESVTAVRPAAGGHHIIDGGSDAGRLCSLPAVAGVGLAAGGLSDDSGDHFLSRRQPGSDGLLGDRAARAKLRADSRLAADDLDEFFWVLGYHFAVRAGSQY